MSLSVLQTPDLEQSSTSGNTDGPLTHFVAGSSVIHAVLREDSVGSALRQADGGRDRLAAGFVAARESDGLREALFSFQGEPGEQHK